MLLKGITLLVLLLRSILCKLRITQMRDKVIKICQALDWQGERDTWESPDGKEIPFIRFSKFIMPENDDMNSYYIQITIWAKNVSLDIKEYCGECGPEIDSDERWAMSRTFRIAKVPHAEFIERSDELIQQVEKVLYEKFTP